MDLLRQPAKEREEERPRDGPGRVCLLELLEVLKLADVDDRIRSAATTLYQALIGAELTAVIGTGPHERSETRTAQHNGSRPRTLTITAGDLELRIDAVSVDQATVVHGLAHSPGMPARGHVHSLLSGAPGLRKAVLTNASLTSARQAGRSQQWYSLLRRPTPRQDRGPRGS